MPVSKLPSGSRGASTPPRLLSKMIMPLMVRVHRRSGDTFQGMDLLYLTTVGARSGEHRTTPVARFDDGMGGWVVVASAGGATQHPAWYHNIAAHPEQVWAEVSGTRHRVEVDQLEGEARDRAWAQVVERSPRFEGYLAKTDRQLPVLRLTPVSEG
jgi:deazaflavin-dependent oxidoreductase (nitroreductase family)